MLLFQVHKEKNYTSPDGSLSYEELERQLLDVFSQAEHAFKINFACGIILRNVTDGTYLYFHPMESDPVLKAPMLITSRVDIAQLVDTIKRMDLIEEMVKRRPNTKYVFHQLANVVYFTYDLEYVLGKGDEGLPAFISNRLCIIDLVSDVNGKNLYEDRKCFFRCLAKNKTQIGRYIEKLLPVPPENDILQELKAQIESSDRTKFKTYKLMNPSLTVHKIYEMQANYVEEHVRLSFSRFWLGSHYLRIETGRWSRTPRDERFCDCGNNQVQDEQHVLRDCAKSLIVRNNYPNLDKDIPMIFENNPHTVYFYRQDSRTL